MKKLNNILKSLVLLICIFIGVNGVSAKSSIEYTEYKKGDVISVRLNDTETMDFYVLSASDENSNTVNAISENTIGDKMNYADAQKHLITLKESWTNVNEITLPSITILLGNVDLTENFEFEEPEYSIIDNSYWTYTGENEKWILGKTEEGNGSASKIALTETAHLRPVITVNKEKVLNGTYVNEEQYAWNNFVTLFKNSDLVKFYKTDEDYTISIISDNSSMKVVLSDETDTWTTNFTYKDGVISYNSPEYDLNSLAKDSLIDSLFVEECIKILAELKDYDYEEVELMIDSTKEEDLKLSEYGIEYTTKTHKYTEEDENGTGEVTISYCSSLKMDLVNGFPQLEKKSESASIKNPDTGIFGKTGLFILIIVICGLAYAGVRSKSKFPKHN